MSQQETNDWPLVAIDHPLENDVVYGRGGLANNHEGERDVLELCV